MNEQHRQSLHVIHTFLGISMLLGDLGKTWAEPQTVWLFQFFFFSGPAQGSINFSLWVKPCDPHTKLCPLLFPQHFNHLGNFAMICSFEGITREGSQVVHIVLPTIQIPSSCPVAPPQPSGKGGSRGYCPTPSCSNP